MAACLYPRPFQYWMIEYDTAWARRREGSEGDEGVEEGVEGWMRESKGVKRMGGERRGGEASGE
jgi:hypothetical protein